MGCYVKAWLFFANIGHEQLLMLRQLAWGCRQRAWRWLILMVNWLQPKCIPHPQYAGMFWDKNWDMSLSLNVRSLLFYRYPSLLVNGFYFIHSFIHFTVVGGQLDPFD